MDHKMQYSLLDDPVIEVQFTNGETRKTNLPDIFCQLLDDNITSFEALQPHQQQPWYSFLVQLGAMAVARENDGIIPSNQAAWRRLLVDLAEGSEAAWHLVVEDVSQPAFMQPPVPEGSLDEAKYKSDIHTPDELDMLVTSKNHDVKGNRILHPQPQYWLYALLTLQTMEGFLGRGNYGIIRMNGGFGNRPFVGLSPNISWGARIIRDIKTLLNNRTNLFNIYNAFGHTILWLNSWNGAKKGSIPLKDCDPFFIEICRRIRFKRENDKIICFRTNTKASRISAPDDLNGRTEDPWTPIEKKGVKALTLGESGFTYKLIQKLLLGEEYTIPIAFKFQQNEQNGAFLIAQVLVRGQGKTDGLHRRIIPIPPKVSVRLFKEPSKKEQLAQKSQQRVKQTEEMQSKILRPALAALLSSGQDQQVDFEKVAPWIERFDREIDQRFFESLWASVEMEPENAKRKWEELLLNEAEKQFKEAERSTPIPQIQRLRALSNARAIFYGRTKSVLEFAGPQNRSVN